jgi:hypothetical protein
MASQIAKLSSSRTVIVCTVGNASFFSQRFFDRISDSVMRVGSGDELIRELSATRPIGVLLVVSDAGILETANWLRTLEQKILFEGMRVVLAIKHDGTNPSRTFGSKNVGKFNLTQCLGLRDLILYDDEITDSDMSSLIDRIKFAFGVAGQGPFADRFRLLAECHERWEISVPARISELEDDRHVVIESAVYLQPGTVLRMRFMSPLAESEEVGLTVIENLPSGLRFNFGNSLRVRIADESWTAVQRLIAVEQPSRVFRKPVRRAMVVTRSIGLRQRIVSCLASSQIEARIPLVRRNIKGDLPPLRPDYLIVEANALTGQSAAEGARELQEYLDLAGSQCLAVIVGRRPDWNLGNHLGSQAGFVTIRDSENIQDDLRSALDKEGRAARSGEVPKSVWFATDSQCSKVMLLLRDRSVSVGDAGLVIETPHVFRLWSNVEARSLDSKAHFIGRISRVFRSEDAFRVMLRLGAKDAPVFMVQIASIAANANLDQMYSAAVAKLALASDLGQVISAKAARAAHPAVKDSANVIDLGIRADNAAEFGRGELRSAGARGTSVSSRNVFGGLAILVVVGIIVLLAVWFGQNDQSVYVESFRKLFELSGKKPLTP